MPERPTKNGEHRLPEPPSPVRRAVPPAAQSLGTPLDFLGGGVRQPDVAAADNAASEPEEPRPPASLGSSPRKQATETIAQRAGALSDEIDFKDFVSGLVHATFDAIVDASIRQMESYADLVSAVAKTVDQFTEDNVTLNQARDWLVQQYPQDLYLDTTGAPKVLPKPLTGDDPEALRTPAWLHEFQLDDQELTPELVENTLVPQARQKVGHSRQQMLATLVLLGLNRVVVRDGSVSARLRFRASAADKASVEYAVSDDPGAGGNWGSRGSNTYRAASTKVSTVGLNVQSDADLKAELFGEVKINFASETVPLDRFVDDARRTILERRAKPVSRALQPSAAAAAPTVATAEPPLATAAPPGATVPALSPPSAPVQPSPSATPANGA